MAEVVVSATVVSRMAEANSQAHLVARALGKLRDDSTRSGLDLKRPRGALDERARTCRVTDFWRMVLCDAGRSSEGEQVLVAIDVLPHDDAYAWCERHRFERNPVTGAFQIIPVAQVDAVAGAMASVARTRSGEPLLAGVRDRELVRLGVPSELVPALRQINADEQLEGITALLPAAVRDALLAVAAGMSVAEAWAQVQTLHAPPTAVSPPPPEGGERVDSASLPPGTGAAADVVPSVPDEELADAALSGASSAELHVFTDDADLRAALQAPLARCRVFLHPRQRAAARRDSYSGPARVTGGPGTGKSIVAIHRVAHLLGRLLDHSDGGEPVLLVTYTTSLAHALRANLVELVGADAAAGAEVRTVDSLARHVGTRLGLRAPRVVSSGRAKRLWEAARQHAEESTSAAFLQAEYEQVVEPQRIDSLDAYLAARRRGRVTPLSRNARRHLWPAFVAYRTQLRDAGLVTWAGAADRVADVLGERGPLYRHAVIDEAQDLTPAHWRLLRAAVEPGPDDLFVAGDGHQRIYAGALSLDRLGIATRGRSTRLTVNYRSTEQILRWAGGIMSDQRVSDLDGDPASLAAYRSMLQGERPETIAAESARAEAEAVVASVRRWVADGVVPHEIAVVGRTKRQVDAALDALNGAGVPAVRLDRDDAEVEKHVVVTTMHRVKGLEYRCVAVVGVDASTSPLKSVIAAAAAADRSVADALLQERSLLYVACTRAHESLTVTWHGERSPFLPVGG